jgi:hypothetical protein
MGPVLAMKPLTGNSPVGPPFEHLPTFVTCDVPVCRTPEIRCCPNLGY